MLDEFTEELSPTLLAAIERETQAVGQYLFAHLRETPPHILQRRWWADRVMRWTMRDEALKTELFRFVDVLPMLTSSDAVSEHLHEYLDRARETLPRAARAILGLSRHIKLTRAAEAHATRIGAMDFARRFIAGSSTAEVIEAAERERSLKRGFTLDILGEAVTSEPEADKYLRAYVELLTAVSPVAAEWSAEPQVDADDRGSIPRVNLSIKLSALDSQFDPIDPAGATQRVGARLRSLLRAAQRLGAFINVDMESYEKKSLTFHIFKTILAETEFRAWPHIGIVAQCYLRDTRHDLVSLRDWAQQRGTPIWVRLVKGAYWDYETIHAQANNWPVPVWQQKWQSDAEYEKATLFVMRNRQWLRPALGSHNLRSLAHGLAVAKHLEIPANGFEVQMLYGMADAEKQALVDLGHRLRIYMPYGELIPGMAYLVRRLLENTSNESFLRAGFVEHRSPEELLRPPAPPLSSSKQRLSKPAPASPDQEPTMSTPADLKATFRNHPPVDFAQAENRNAMLDALADVHRQLGDAYPLFINGEEIETNVRKPVRDPSMHSRIVGEVFWGDERHAAAAVAAAANALPEWRALGAEGRAEIIRRVADAMRQRFFELAAWEVFECGKGWREATYDICEAIDFCEYYAAGAVALDSPHGGDAPGEENRFEYLPRGVTAVIAPWNFPLAIITGMTVAALATGNTVVMKPAEQASITAAKLMELFADAELPTGVLNYVPGAGEVVGAALVAHPQVSTIVFTGSRAVGLAINAKAAAVSGTPGVPFVKRVIAEMGGKNAIIVDADADLDEAVLGVMKSAFGYQGQKCSACSRAIVLAPVYDAFLTRLVEATRSLHVGPAESPTTSVGPVIDEASRAKIHEYIAIGQREGRSVLATDVGKLAEQGYFVGPHIFADVAPTARLAQEEVFGPVLAVIRAENLDEALQIANNTEYALTGGAYSRSPANLERIRRELLVGNLYLNRPITGALVGRQPFGGFKMSGIGSKAGGPDYLLQFVLPRTITENTLRRGFAPPAEESANE